MGIKLLYTSGNTCLNGHWVNLTENTGKNIASSGDMKDTYIILVGRLKEKTRIRYYGLHCD
jgi:hypothetical protein